MIESLVNKGFTRRDLGIALITPAAGLIIACGSEAQQSSAKTAEPQRLPKPDISATAALTALPTATVLSRLDELKYPEVDLYRPKAQGRFKVGRSEITWINHSDFNFSQDAASAIFTYLSDFQARLPRPTITIEGTDFQLNLRQRPNIARKIYLIGSHHLMPYWWREIPTDRLGITRTLERTDQDQESFTVIRIQQPAQIKSIDEIDLAFNTDNNAIFVAEAAQSSISFSGSDNRILYVVQEVFNITLGMAYFFRQIGLNHQQFSFLAPRTRIPVSDTSHTYAYPLPKEEFEKIPTRQIVTKN